MQAITLAKNQKSLYIENTVTFDYGQVTGFETECEIDKILGDFGNNLVCVAPTAKSGGGIQVIRIEKVKKYDQA